MARDTLPIPGRSITPSGVVLGPLTVGAAGKTIEVRMDCAGYTTSTTFVTLTFELSHDQGQTWRFVTSTTRPGGSQRNEDGSSSTIIRFAMDLEAERGAGRRMVQCLLAVTGEAFVSSGGSIEVHD